jgi:hypothetical protein
VISQRLRDAVDAPDKPGGADESRNVTAEVASPA